MERWWAGEITLGVRFPGRIPLVGPNTKNQYLTFDRHHDSTASTHRNPMEDPEGARSHRHCERYLLHILQSRVRRTSGPEIFLPILGTHRERRVHRQLVKYCHLLCGLQCKQRHQTVDALAQRQVLQRSRHYKAINFIGCKSVFSISKLSTGFIFPWTQSIK